ncbi:hypothetical protein ACHAWF_005489 [Thalassiosira exigua]
MFAMDFARARNRATTLTENEQVVGDRPRHGQDDEIDERRDVGGPEGNEVDRDLLQDVAHHRPPRVLPHEPHPPPALRRPPLHLSLNSTYQPVDERQPHGREDEVAQDLSEPQYVHEQLDAPPPSAFHVRVRVAPRRRRGQGAPRSHRVEVLRDRDPRRYGARRNPRREVDPLLDPTKRLLPKLVFYEEVRVQDECGVVDGDRHRRCYGDETRRGARGLIAPGRGVMRRAGGHGQASEEVSQRQRDQGEVHPQDEAVVHPPALLGAEGGDVNGDEEGREEGERREGHGGVGHAELLGGRRGGRVVHNRFSFLLLGSSSSSSARCRGGGTDGPSLTRQS